MPETPLDLTPRLAPLRDALDRAGFTEAAVSDRLGVPELPSIRPRLQALPLYLWRTRTGTPLDVLIRLFLLHQSAPIETAAAAVAPSSLSDWSEVGLLQVNESAVQAALELTPYQSLRVAADWPEAAEAEPVMSVAATTRALAQVTIRRPVTRTLDLGTGCGLLALLAAGHSEQVSAVDLNPRATRLTAFNAQLNGLTNIEPRAGDLFEPVKGETFDLILCNPPFVVGPEQKWLHTHGGRPLDHLCRDIIRTAPTYLREGGFCQLVCNWVHRTGEDPTARLASWFDGTGCDAWVLRVRTEDAVTYALSRAREMAEGDDLGPRFDDWMAYYERERIEAISFGVITMQRSAGPRWFQLEPMPEMRGSCGRAIEQRFLQRAFLQSCRQDRDLLARRLRPTESMRCEMNQKLAGGRWISSGSQLCLTDGLAFRGNADPAVLEFIAGCTGDRPLGDHLKKAAARAGQPVDRLTPEFLKVVRRLVELGFLVSAP